MTFWNISNPRKPTGIKRVGAVLPYPIKISDWLTEEGDSYASHTVINLTEGLVLVSSEHSAGIITIWLSGGTENTIASFTLRLVTSGGRIETVTLYLKILP